MVPYERSDTIGFLNVLYTFLCTMISCVRKIKGIRFRKKEQNGYIGCVDISICKNDKAFTVLVYFFKRISMRMGYTHFSLVCQCNTNDFLYETWFHLYSMLKKKKKERRADNAIYKKEKKNPYMCKKRRKDNDERLKLELSFNQWDTGNRSIMVSLKGQLNFLSLFIRNKSWNKRFVIPIVHITMNGP